MRNLIFVPLLLLALSACSKPAEQAEPIRPALVYTVTAGNPQQSSVYSGEVHARREADLGFRVGGKVTQRLVELGSVVKPGEVLARLDPQDAQLATTEARAQLAAAQSDASNARIELERAQKLVAQKFLSQAALDARINASQSTNAKLAATRAQLGIATNQSRYTALTAEAAGVVTQVNVEPGQVVSAGQPVLRVAYAGDKEIHVRVGEAQASQIKVGAPAQVKLWSAPGQVFAGSVREVAPAADEARTYLVKVTLLKPDERIRLGMSASVALAGNNQGATVTVPAGAVFQHGTQPAVWLVNAQQQVAAVPVRIVQYREDGVLVEAALPAGSRVIAAGAHKLHDRQKITPMPFNPASGSAL
jgi:multidrug efflux system membrane fusion protein